MNILISLILLVVKSYLIVVVSVFTLGVVFFVGILVLSGISAVVWKLIE